MQIGIRWETILQSQHIRTSSSSLEEVNRSMENLKIELSCITKTKMMLKEV